MIVGSVSRAMFSYLTTRDQNLMRRLNGWRPPRWVRVWMVLASRLGDGWLWWSIGIVLLLFGGPVRFVAFGGAGSRALPENQEAVQPHQALRDLAELLGHALAAGSILVSIRTFHDGLRRRRASQHVLSRAGTGIALLRFQHRPIAHSTGTALP